MKIKKLILLLILGILIFILIKKFPFRKESEFKSIENVIVIDAGHGDHDPGTIGYSGSYEKDINLKIAKKLANKLEKEGYIVILTRENDEYIDNPIRAEIANENQASVFISIHNNALKDNTTVKGVQVLYYPDRESNIDDPNNNELARMIMGSILDKTKAVDKGMIKREDLIVLNKTKMPAVLIECGFLSNKQEEKLLQSDKYQNKIVNGIVKGLEEYFHKEE